MNITRSDVDALFLPGRVVAVEYIKKDLTSTIIGDAEGDPASHALCCLGGLDIVEASASGVIESNLRNYLRGNCRLTVRSALGDPTPVQISKATKFWLDRVNDPYDWGMILGSAPILLVHKIVGSFSKNLADSLVRKMPNLLANSSLSTCAELAARGLREFSLIAFCYYPVENVTPGILRTDSTLRTEAVLDGCVLVD